MHARTVWWGGLPVMALVAVVVIGVTFVVGWSGPGWFPAASSGDRSAFTCPRPEASASGTVGRAVRVPTASGARNDPAAEALAQALGEQAGTAFADVYGSLIVDHPYGRVALCVTDLARGRRLVEAAHEAHPTVEVSRLDLYTCAYPLRVLAGVGPRLAQDAEQRFGFPVYTVAPVADASGVEVTTTTQGAASESFRHRLVDAAGGIPVTVIAGEPIDTTLPPFDLGMVDTTPPGQQTPSDSRASPDKDRGGYMADHERPDYARVMGGQFHRDYLAGVESDPDDFERQKVSPRELSPSDMGEVYVTHIVEEDDLWIAVWQRGEDARSHDGTEAEVVRWARDQEASHYWIYGAAARAYRPLDRIDGDTYG